MTKLVVGLIGQVCAGKSTVAEAFKRRGAAVYNADDAVRELYAQPGIVAQVRALFGGSVLDGHGRVDCHALGRLVFNDPARLRLLTEQVVFPRTREAIEGAIGRFRRSSVKVLLLDAPTLIESGQAAVCDRLVFVAAPVERRREWARARGWPPGELEKRDACLADDQEKRRAATAVIVNDGTLEDVQRHVDGLLAAWSGVEGNRKC